MAGCHPSDLEAWRKCGDNQVAGEGILKVPAPPWYSLSGGPELSSGELRGATPRARGGAKSPRSWAKGTFGWGASWNWAGFPTVGREVKEESPSLSHGLGEGQGGQDGVSRGHWKKDHSVGTRELQLAEEIIVVLMDSAAPCLLQRERAGSF